MLRQPHGAGVGEVSDLLVKIARNLRVLAKGRFLPSSGPEDPPSKHPRWVDPSCVPRRARRTPLANGATVSTQTPASRRLPSCEGAAGFRLRSATRETDASARETRRAIAAAKQGDRDALRFLYVRYADNVY